MTKRTKRKLQKWKAHASARLVERFNGGIGVDDILGEIAAGRVEYLIRQSQTRTVCRCCVEGIVVCFVLNRDKGSIVTVLTEAQVEQLWREAGREGPARGHQTDLKKVLMAAVFVLTLCI